MQSIVEVSEENDFDTLIPKSALKSDSVRRRSVSSQKSDGQVSNEEKRNGKTPTIQEYISKKIDQSRPRLAPDIAIDIQGDDNAANNNEVAYGFVEVVKTAVQTNLAAAVGKIGNAWLPQLQARCFYYSLILIVLSLVLFGSAGSSNLHGVSSHNWYEFFLVVMLSDTTMMMLDEVIFVIIDVFWIVGYDELRFYILCFNGPLGFSMCLFMINAFFITMKVPQAFSTFNKLTSTAITICALYTIRKIYQRYNYNRLMESKYSEKLAMMDLEATILSALATHNPPDDKTLYVSKNIDNANTNYAPFLSVPFRMSSKSKLVAGGGEEGNDPSNQVTHTRVAHVDQGNRNHKKEGNLIEQSQVTSERNELQGGDEVEENDQYDHYDQYDQAIATLKKTTFGRNIINFVHSKRRTSATSTSSNLKEIFSEIVESSAEDEYDADLVDTKEINRKVFWSRMNSVSHGYLKVDTYAGMCVIRTKQQLHSFVKCLYYHLCKMEHQDHIDIASRKATIQGSLAIKVIRESPLFNSSKQNAGHSNVSSLAINVNSAVQHLKTIFRIDESANTVINYDLLKDTCSAIYKTHRYAAVALNDYGELQKSLARLVDVVFWIFMSIVAQIILEIDTLSIFAPLLTIIFGVSFAIGPTIGNVCMAIGFVLFMLPFDVGDRIAVGVGATKIIGNVSSITLLNTTVITVNNEMLLFPNHVLFSEKILNLKQSTSAVLEIPVSFAIYGPSAPSQEIIAQFWVEIRNFIFVEDKENWVDCFVTAHTVDATNNNLTYSIWVTNRASFAQVRTLFHCRTTLIEKMLQIQRQLGITYMNVPQPVDILSLSSTAVGDANTAGGGAGSVPFPQAFLKQKL